MKFYFKQMLKITALWLDKQKSLFLKKISVISPIPTLLSRFGLQGKFPAYDLNFWLISWKQPSLLRLSQLYNSMRSVYLFLYISRNIVINELMWKSTACENRNSGNCFSGNHVSENLLKGNRHSIFHNLCGNLCLKLIFFKPYRRNTKSRRFDFGHECTCLTMSPLPKMCALHTASMYCSCPSKWIQDWWN